MQFNYPGIKKDFVKFLFEVAKAQNQHEGRFPARNCEKQAKKVIDTVTRHYFSDSHGPMITGFVDENDDDDDETAPVDAEMQSPSLLSEDEEEGEDAAGEPDDESVMHCLMLQYALVRAWRTYVENNEGATFMDSLDHLMILSLLGKSVVWPL